MEGKYLAERSTSSFQSRALELTYCSNQKRILLLMHCSMSLDDPMIFPLFITCLEENKLVLLYSLEMFQIGGEYEATVVNCVLWDHDKALSSTCAA